MGKAGKDERRNLENPRKPATLGNPKISAQAGKAIAIMPGGGTDTLRDGKDIEVSVIPVEKAGGAEAVEQVISINRITKVTKGGKKLSFSALVVVGDTKGCVGYSLSKAAEVSIAIRKAIAVAKKNMIQIPLHGTTIPHEIIGRCGGASVLLKPASDGTGVIAAGPVRAVCDGVGIRNILSKCHRSNNPINVVKATLDGLTRLKAISAISTDTQG
jgi:small subunit ribosomal protein S5